MSENQLLGNSQTFIGVLATIVILCVVTGSGNFIYTILEGFARPTRRNIGKLKDKLGNQVSFLRNAKPHKDFLDFVESINGNSSLSSSIKDISNQYKILYTISIDEFTGRYSSTYLVPLENRSKDIRRSREQTFAPLFVFAYCVLVFICDEVVAWAPSAFPYILRGLAIFTLLSTVFLLGLWIKFYYEFCLSPLDKCRDNEDSGTVKIPFRKVIKITLVNALAPVLALVACLWIIDSTVVRLNRSVAVWLVCVGIVVPLCILGCRHIKLRFSFGHYSHSFLLWHFGNIFVLSAIYTFLLFLPLDCLVSADNPYSANQWQIQCAVIVFVILFGIIFPFWIPYHCYKKIYEFSVDEYNVSSRRIITESKAIESKIGEYLHDLKKWMAIEDNIDYERFAGLDCCPDIMSENINPDPPVV